MCSWGRSARRGGCRHRAPFSPLHPPSGATSRLPGQGAGLTPGGRCCHTWVLLPSCFCPALLRPLPLLSCVPLLDSVSPTLRPPVPWLLGSPSSAQALLPVLLGGEQVTVAKSFGHQDKSFNAVCLKKKNQNGREKFTVGTVSNSRTQGDRTQEAGAKVVVPLQRVLASPRPPQRVSPPPPPLGLAGPLTQQNHVSHLSKPWRCRGSLLSGRGRAHGPSPK